MQKLIELGHELVTPGTWPVTIVVISIICLAILGYMEVHKGRHLNQ